MRSLPDDDMGAVTAFAEADLGACRRTQRVVAWATVLAQRPGASLPAACGARATITAASRCVAKAALAPQHLLDRHVDAPLGRLAAVPRVVAGPETTALDWTAPPAPTGVGPLGPPAPRGRHGHTTLVFPPARGPLGLLAQQVWARAPNDVGQRATRTQRPLAEQASQQWLPRVAAVLAARGEGPQTRGVSVSAREADGYERLALARPAGVALRMRAAGERGVALPEHDGWATVAPQPVEATDTVQGPRRGAQPPRTATLAVRWGPLTWCPPRQRQRAGVPAVPRWAVQALEEAPPAGTAPLAWLLWTTGAVHTPTEALTRVDW